MESVILLIVLLFKDLRFLKTPLGRQAHILKVVRLSDYHMKIPTKQALFFRDVRRLPLCPLNIYLCR